LSPISQALAAASSSSGAATVISAMLPPVSRNASGRPAWSIRTWILVVRPPRERPMAWSRSPFCAARRPVRSHRGAVDHHHARRFGTLCKRAENTLPQAALAPPVVPVEHRRIRPVFSRQGAPAAALTQTVQDAADDAPIILPHRPGVHHRQQRRDRRPLRIAQPKIVRHDPSPSQELESHSLI